MTEDFKAQADEILALCRQMGIDPEELGSRAGIAPETMRKYANGYQKASEIAMRGLRMAAQIQTLLREESETGKPLARAAHSYVETETLDRTLSDLANRLAKVQPHERKYVLGNIREVLDELDQRDIAPAAVPSAVDDPAGGSILEALPEAETHLQHKRKRK